MKHPRKLNWKEPKHYPVSEPIHLPPAEEKYVTKIRPAKGRKQPNPHHEEPKPKYPERVPRNVVEKPVPKRYVKLKNYVILDGVRWELVTTTTAQDAGRIAAFGKRAGKEYKAVKISDDLFELYERV